MKELLLLLCCYPFEEVNREPLSKLVSQVEDWPATLELINAHGIVALAAYNIKEADLERAIPPDMLTSLNNGYMKSMARNAWLMERWKELNIILCNAGIKHILLKGMALEHTVYGSIGLRQMNDNDILIKHEESFKAWQLLQQEGFTVEPLKSPLFRTISGDINKHLPTLYKKGYAVDIHDDLFENISSVCKDFSDVFANAVEITLAGTKAFILPEKVQLLHLIKHFEGHALAGDCQLRLYRDIHILDKKSTVDIPAAFISDPIQSHKTEFRRAAYLANLKMIPKWKKLLYILGDTFPSVEWMKKRYNCNCLKLLIYYPVRICKLLWLIKL
jgi:hypothetical protein